jgi:CheY-like chemotaxis protein
MKKKTIMIVDDNPDSQYILDLALKGSGYDVVHVTNGYDALDKLEERDITLIVSDILMPGMDGFQLCWKVKSDETKRNIPFVFYSAYYTGKSDENFAMNIGAQKFITKPTDIDKFVDEIKQVINECENSKLPSPKFAYSDPDAFLREYVARLKGGIERTVLGVSESTSLEVHGHPALSEIPPDVKQKEIQQNVPNKNVEMGSYEEIIIKALSGSVNGYTTNQLAKTTGISRTTIIKYLSVLKERGIVDYVKVGPSKLWFSKTVENPPSSEPTTSNIAHI